MAEVATIDKPMVVLIPQKHGGALMPGPKKGEIRNPLGRPSAGASFREECNRMQSWAEADIRAVADNSDERMVARQAARSLLRAANDAYFNATPLAANDLDRICDRTEGKPTQRIEVAKVERDPDSIMHDLAAMLQSHPDLLADMAALLPVDTTAQVLSPLDDSHPQ